MPAMTRISPLSVFAFGLFFAASAHGEVLSSHGDWDAVKEAENGKPVCFMSSRPQKDEGDYTQRGDIYVIVTHRPAEQSTGVVSVVAGYPYKPGAPVIVSIDKAKTFSLFTQGGFAWTREQADDKALTAAMRGGNSMVVTGTSSRGTQTIDTYSLSGFTAAYKAISDACNVK